MNVVCRNVGKWFPGVRALHDVSIEVEAGTCHGLVGENGAGKSTLGKILAGLHMADEGTIEVDGAPVILRSPADAAKACVGMVHQELLFCENLSVAENLTLHNPPCTGPFYDRKAAVRQALEWLEKVGAQVDPSMAVGELSVAKQQLVQIAGALSQGARVLIFDEPTSSLSQVETNRLLELIRELKDNGVTCIYISHRLDEVFRICDRVTVLRDGELVGTLPIMDLDQGKLVAMMVGRTLERSGGPVFPDLDAPVLLHVEHFSSPGRFEDVGFELRSGEILGIAGLVGSGRTEILETLFGLRPNAQTITLKGDQEYLCSPWYAFQMGIGLIPEDRKRHGLVLQMTARENITLPILRRFSAWGWIIQNAERRLAREYFERLRVRARSTEALTAGLSGGNQQKLVLAKWVAAKCDVLLVDEPTRGVDVGAKEEIHALLRELAQQGKGIVLVSSELPELLALSSRILVMREGRMVGEVSNDVATENVLMRMMAGVGAA